MVTSPVKEKLSSSTLVEQLLRRNRASDTADLLGNVATAYTLLGVLEVLCGLLALGSPFMAGAFFAFLAGIAVLVGGVTETISSIINRSGGRFFIGLIGIIAGALMVAHPILNLGFLTLLLGLYLIASGALRIAAFNESGWMLAGGVISLLLGILVLAGWPSSSLTILGIYVGVGLLFGGMSMLTLGSAMRTRLHAMAARHGART